MVVHFASLAFLEGICGGDVNTTHFPKLMTIFLWLMGNAVSIKIQLLVKGIFFFVLVAEFLHRVTPPTLGKGQIFFSL